MSLAVALYTAALALPLPGYAQETTDDRAARLTVIALAIAAETERADEWAPGWTRQDWAWGVFTIAWYESGRFALRVHNGKLRGDQRRSVCLVQRMHGSERLVGVDLESTRRCIAEGLRVMVMHRDRCGAGPASPYTMSQVIGAFGTGYSCRGNIKFAARRSWTWARLRNNPS